MSSTGQVTNIVGSILDPTDTSKIFSVNTSGAATNTKSTLLFTSTVDRTYTIPDASTTLVGNNTTQTLTNKTIDASLNTLTNVTGSSSIINGTVTNALLTNSSLTVTAGTGLTGGGSVSLGATSTINLSVPVSSANGGTGVNNGSNTITLGGNIVTGGDFTTSGANAITFTSTGPTNVTLPTSGTLLTSVTAVTTFSTGTTGLTPSVATSGPITLSGTLTAGNGGTGTSTTPTAGQLPVGVTGGTYIPFTVTTGTGISTTTGSGTFQINNTGVTSLAGTTNQITSSASTGSVTLSTPNTFIAPGSIASTSTLTAGTFLITGTDSSVAAAGTTQGTATALTTTYNIITTAASGTGVVLPTSVAGEIITIVNKGANTVNVYPALGSSIDSASLNAAVTIPVNGTATYQAKNGTQWYSTSPVIIAGSGISVAYGNGQTTITNAASAGTVSSVGLTMPSIFSVSGSPVTSSGTLAVTSNTQGANFIYAGPTSGAAAVPTFRALARSDIPPEIMGRQFLGIDNIVQTPVNGTFVTMFPSSFIGSLTFPANELTSFNTIQFRIGGILSSAGGINVITLRVMIGPTANIQVCTSPGNGIGVNSGVPFVLNGILTVRSTGVSGTIIGDAGMTANNAGGSNVYTGTITTTTATIDTTVANTLDVQLGYSAGAGNTFTTVSSIVWIA